MSKEREEAYRSMHKSMNNSTHEYMPEKAPLLKNVNENALSSIWASDSRVLIDGKWYVSISDVSEILYNKDADPEPDPLSEEWQVDLFPNLNIGKPKKIECCGTGCCDHEMNRSDHEEEILFEELKAEKIRECGNERQGHWEIRNT